MSVNAFASTPYNVAVGGTDFGDVYSGQTNAYWNPTNSITWSSARSYVPEISWNGSCASQLAATYYGFAAVYGSQSLCNSPTVRASLLTGLWAVAARVVVRLGNPPPSDWSAEPVPVIPNLRGSRCLETRMTTCATCLMSLSSRHSEHGSIPISFVIQTPSNSGTPCTTSFQASGGTSTAAPVMAGIQALINQNTGQSWGNPNPVYYALARAQYGTAGTSSCDASLGNGIALDCIYHDITQGDNVVICLPGSPNCYAPSGAYGVLSLSTSSFQPAFPATIRWDFTTGIGSVDAYNLVMNWNRGVALTRQVGFGTQQ